MSNNITPNQIQIDISFHQARLTNLIGSQGRDALYAFGSFDSPNETVRQNSIYDYWRAEHEIQNTLSILKKLKETI